MLPQSRDADIRDGKAKSSVVNVERGRLNEDGELVAEYDRRNRILTNTDGGLRGRDIEVEVDEVEE